MRRGYSRTLVDSPQSTAAPPERLGRIGPAVHAIVVAHEPGEWFGECLQSLRDQDYSALSVTVVNVSPARAGEAGGAPDVVDRVAAVMPDATVMAVPGNPGFGPAVNAAARHLIGGGADDGAADGLAADPLPLAAAAPSPESTTDSGPTGAGDAAFLLVCHDDVALDPDAVRRLVDEAVRRRAAAVGPKLVDWDNPGFLQCVGLSSDRMGVPVPLVTAGEYDQGQHDSVAEVLAVPSACLLIRAEVFDRLGGFDGAMTYHGEDLDLGRRVNLDGGTVLVAPAARVRHRGRLAERRPRRDRDLLAYRHQLRSVLVCGSRSTLPSEALLMLGLTVLEASVALLAGHLRRAAAVLGAWWWNLLGLAEILNRRRLAGDSPDYPRVRSLTRYGYVSVARYMERLVRGDVSVEASGVLWGRRRRLADAVRDTSVQTTALSWLVVMAIFIFGSRHLLTRGVPVIGEVALLGESPADLFGAWFSDRREAGLGSNGPAPTAYAILGVASSLLVGAMGLTRTVLLLGLVPFGAAGLWRLLAPSGRRAQIVGLAAFVAMPLPYNAFANGVWSALAVYGTLPWICLWLARALGEPSSAETAPSMSLWRCALAVGVLVALLGAFVPVAPLIVVLLVVALAAGGLLAGSARRLLQLAGAAVGGLLAGWLLNWPAAATSPGGLFSGAGARPHSGGGLSVGELLRFDTGSAAGGRLVWGLLAAAALALFVTRGGRFSWTVRAWSLVLLSVLAALAAEGGWSRWDLPRPEVLLAPGAFGVALAIALGAAGVSAGSAAGRMRKRILAAAGLVAVVGGSIPALALTLDGRWGMPRGDFRTPLAAVEEESRLGAFRILWVGHPDVLPLGGWALDDRLVYATSASVPPGVGLRWPGPQPPEAAGLRGAWRDAMSGRTDRMGERLAPLGVRYVVVMERLAPEPFGEFIEPVPESVHARLGAQFDLERQESRDGVAVYRNIAWHPTRALLAGTAEVTPGGIAASTALALPEFDPPSTARGALPAGSTLYLADAADGWVLHVDGTRVEPAPALGWAQAFRTDPGGDAVLRHESTASNAGRIALWAVVVAVIALAGLRRRLKAAPVPRSGEAEESAEDLAAVLLSRERLER